jgi:hypothetical protein
MALGPQRQVLLESDPGGRCQATRDRLHGVLASTPLVLYRPPRRRHCRSCAVSPALFYRPPIPARAKHSHISACSARCFREVFGKCDRVCAIWPAAWAPG